MRILESESQRAIAAHRNASDAARPPPHANAVMAFDVRDKLSDEKILVSHFPVAKNSCRMFCRHSGVTIKEFADSLLIAKVLNHQQAAGIEQRLFVFPQSVQKIKHGVALRCI